MSLGGDSDTLAAIAGSVAEAFYGVPEEMKKAAMSYMDDYIASLFEETKVTK